MTKELYDLVAGVLTDSQLDFQPADGGLTIRQRMTKIGEALNAQPVLAPPSKRDQDARFTLEVVVGNSRDDAGTLYQNYQNRDMADRGYLVACKGVLHVQVVRHGEEGSHIVQSFAPGEKN